MASSERLPWLNDDPAPAARSTATPGPRAMWPWYLLLALLIGLVGAGAWWLGTRQQQAAPPQLPAEESMPVPVRPAAPAETEASSPESATEPALEIAAPPVARPRPSPGQGIERRQPDPPAERSVTAEVPTGRSVFPADEPAIAPPITGPTPIVVYHPQPNRGRVVQLGAFPTRAQAEDSWRRVTRRYPYLATKPKMVNSVEVRGLGGGRPTRMYRLQLGTSSQAQAAVICQQLERAGQSCVVVY